jgi:capsular exopolysaccharide synthesis family protein
MSFLRRYVLWIIIATVACIAGSWAIAARQPAQFAASASVDVEASVIPGVAPVAPNLATELQVATSGSVLSAASSLLGTSNQQLLKHLSVSNKAGTNILQIACSDSSATAAAACANTVATAYSNFRNDVTSPAATQANDPLHATIVTYAALPTSKSSKRKLELLVLGVILGLMLGVGTAYMRDRLDDRVRDRADLGRCLNAPVLSDIPAVRRGSVRPEVGVIDDPRSPLAEAYRHVRARISPLLVSTGSQGKVLLVSSAQPREGRTSVAINLAAVMAFTGANVLLVDADLRNQALSHQLQVAREPGLTDLLADQAKIGDVIRPASLAPGLSFMAAGTITDRPVDLFDPARLRRTFGQLRVIADVVIIDSGPVRTVSDPLALVPFSDIVMVVADVSRTRRAAVTATAEEIRESGTATMVGVLNRVRQPWKRDLAPARGTGGTRQTTLGAQEARENGAAKIAASPNGTAKAGRPKPASAERDAEPAPLRSDGEPARAAANGEPARAAANGEPVTSHDDPSLGGDDTMMGRAVEPSPKRVTEAAGAVASSDGSGPSESEATQTHPPGEPSSRPAPS